MKTMTGDVYLPSGIGDSCYPLHVGTGNVR